MSFSTSAVLRAQLVIVFLAMSCSVSSQAQVPPPETVEHGRPGSLPDLSAPAIQFRQSAEVGTLEQVHHVRRPDTLTVYTSQSYFHTDNLFLTTPNAQHADAWVGALGLSVVPYSTYRWTPSLTVEGSLVRFDRASAVDYNAQTIAINNRLGLTEDNMLSWNLRASALRSEGERSGLGEFYKRIEVGSDLNWFLPLERTGHWLFHISPGVTWRGAHPAFEDRVYAGAMVSVLWFPHSKWALEPFFEGGYGYYPNDSPTLLDRRDVHLRGGMNCLWRISNHATVGASAYWLGNYSSAAGGDYQVLPNLTLNVQFGF